MSKLDGVLVISKATGGNKMLLQVMQLIRKKTDEAFRDKDREKAEIYRDLFEEISKLRIEI